MKNLFCIVWKNCTLQTLFLKEFGTRFQKKLPRNMISIRFPHQTIMNISLYLFYAMFIKNVSYVEYTFSSFEHIAFHLVNYAMPLLFQELDTLV